MPCFCGWYRVVTINQEGPALGLMHLSVVGELCLYVGHHHHACDVMMHHHSSHHHLILIIVINFFLQYIVG